MLAITGLICALLAACCGEIEPLVRLHLILDHAVTECAGVSQGQLRGRITGISHCEDVSNVRPGPGDLLKLPAVSRDGMTGYGGDPEKPEA